MYSPIAEVLNKTGRYSQLELVLFEKELLYRKLKREDYLLTKGEICSSVYFIIEGALYQYKINSEQDKSIIDLNLAKDCVLNYKSFILQEPSAYYIQAYEDTSIYELSIDSIHKLIAISPSFLQMGRLMDETLFRIEFYDNNFSPDEKYEHILNNKPQIIQKFSQKLIASYLNITPETLSRVRSRYFSL
ncbi:hypothetical protein AEQU3_02996 [Aequorivita antarctica]|nr:hypothetical protein AEQU3_02996 [Aequorivita antarctica]